MTTAVLHGRRFMAVAGLACLGLAAGLFLGTAGNARGVPGQAPSPSPSPVATFTPTPSPALSPTPPPPPPTPPPFVPEKVRSLPAGPVSADPVRVHTGDGDCLNVRYAPGTANRGDPRTCVPEGTLLWLYGPAEQVYGENWRFALGEGWIATRYTRAAGGNAAGWPSGLSSVLAVTSDGVETAISVVDAAGHVGSVKSIDYVEMGIGARPWLISPDGRWAVHSPRSGSGVELRLVSLNGGPELRLPGAEHMAWSNNGKLLVTIADGPLCPRTCSRAPAYIDPRDGVVHPLGEPALSATSGAWTPDGKTVILRTETSLVRVTLAGIATIIVARLPEDAGFGGIVVSPDGKRALLGATAGAVTVVDLATGGMTGIKRAPQSVLGGRCGGPSGQLSGWLDNDTVIWHESFAEKGNNGLTIVDLKSGSRRILPIFSVQDIRPLGGDAVAFTTYESPGSTGFPLTWLLDLRTGDPRPITVGEGSVWLP